MASIVHDPNFTVGGYTVLISDDLAQRLAWIDGGKVGPQPRRYTVWSVDTLGQVRRCASRRFQTLEAAEKKVAKLTAALQAERAVIS